MRDLPPVLEPLTHIPAYTAGEPSTLAYYERTRSQNRSYGSSGSTGGTKSHKINLTANDTNGSVTDSPIFHIQKDTSAPTKSVVQICDMEGKTLLSVEREFSAVSWKPPMRIVDAKGEVILDMKWHKKCEWTL